ncbi:hypothetical protein [Pseudomonas sp. FW300-N1A1]|nr:hypothetical protein [Pseudomonas sp. FW300-N1A1]
MLILVTGKELATVVQPWANSVSAIRQFAIMGQPQALMAHAPGQRYLHS